MADASLARDRRKYFIDYYVARKEELSETRKKKYLEDPEYREKALKLARDYRKKQREKREKLRAAGKLPPAHPSGPRPPISVRVGSLTTVAYTVGRVAQEINRSRDVLNYWTRVGLLPQTPYRSPRGDRLYTEGMVLVLKLAVDRRGRVDSKDATFPEEIRLGWRALGVPMS